MGALVIEMLEIVGLVVLLIVTSFWVISVVRRHPAADGDVELAARLDALAGRGIRRIAAAVVDLNGGGHSIRSAGIRANRTTRFEIGSITKVLTGMLLADAVERGEVTLKTTVADLDPATAGYDLGSVTLRQLATHTSGLPGLPNSPGTVARVLAFGLLGSNPYRGSGPARVFHLAARARLQNPGEYRYSNLGAAVLGQLLARSAGTNYPAVLVDRILTPLGMTGADVATRDTMARPGRSAHGLPRTPWILDGYAAAGGVVATLADLTRLAMAMLTGGAPGTASAIPLLDIPGPPHRRIGMFWMIDRLGPKERTVIWYNGATGGYSAFIGLYPQDGRAVVVLADHSDSRRTEAIATDPVRTIRDTDPPEN